MNENKYSLEFTIFYYQKVYFDKKRYSILEFPQFSNHVIPHNQSKINLYLLLFFLSVFVDKITTDYIIAIKENRCKTCNVKCIDFCFIEALNPKQNFV